MFQMHIQEFSGRDGDATKVNLDDVKEVYLGEEQEEGKRRARGGRGGIVEMITASDRKTKCLSRCLPSHSGIRRLP